MRPSTVNQAPHCASSVHWAPFTSLQREKSQGWSVGRFGDCRLESTRAPKVAPEIMREGPSPPSTDARSQVECRQVWRQFVIVAHSGGSASSLPVCQWSAITRLHWNLLRPHRLGMWFPSEWNVYNLGCLRPLSDSTCENIRRRDDIWLLTVIPPDDPPDNNWDLRYKGHTSDGSFLEFWSLSLKVAASFALLHQWKPIRGGRSCPSMSFLIWLHLNIPALRTGSHEGTF